MILADAFGLFTSMPTISGYRYGYFDERPISRNDVAIDEVTPSCFAAAS